MAPEINSGDISMLTYWRGGERLVTRELGEVIATHLTRNKFGQEHLDQQLPFIMSETATEWIIFGSKTILILPIPGTGPNLGKVEIVISKKNCCVLSFLIHGEFAVSD